MKSKRLLIVFGLILGSLFAVGWSMSVSQRVIAYQESREPTDFLQRNTQTEESDDKRVPIDPPLPNPNWFSAPGNSQSFGIEVVTADINGDLLDDLIVGDPHADDFTSGVPRYDTGAIYIYTSTIDALASEPIIIYGRQEGEQFGTGLAVGDFVYGDGLNELAVGAPYYNDFGNNLDHVGAVYIFTGTSGFPPSANWTIPFLEPAIEPALVGNQSYSEFGYELLALEDLSLSGGDLADELIVGAPNYNGSGGVFAYVSLTGGFLPTPTVPLFPPNDNSGRFGHTLVAGDFEGDGSVSSFAVGAPKYTRINGPEEAGAIFTFELRETGTVMYDTSVSLIPIYGDVAYGWLGWSLAAAQLAGDDNFDDILAGAPGYVDQFSNKVGAAAVYSAADLQQSLPRTVESAPPGGPLPNSVWTAYGKQFEGDFGYSVAVGNFNQNPTPDIVVGAKRLDLNYYDEGAALFFLTHGSETLPVPEPNWIVGGNQGSAYIGANLAFGTFGFGEGLVAIGTGLGLNAGGGAAIYYRRMPSPPPMSPPIFENDTPQIMQSTVNFEITPTWGVSTTDIVYLLAYGDGWQKLFTGPVGRSSNQLVQYWYGWPGLYIAELSVFSPNGPPFILTDTAEILPPPVGLLLIEDDSPTSRGRSTNFRLNLVDPVDPQAEVTLSVDYGDNTPLETVSDAQFPLTLTHAYTKAGGYSPVFTVENSFDSWTTHWYVSVQERITGLRFDNDSPTRYNPNNPQATTFGVNVDTGDPVNLIFDPGDDSGAVYFYDVSVPFFISHTYNLPKLYTANLVAFNDLGMRGARSEVAIYAPGDVTPGGGGSGNYDDPSTGANVGFNAPPGAVNSDVVMQFTPRTGPGEFPTPSNLISRPLIYFDFQINQDGTHVPLADETSCVFLPYITAASGYSGGTTTDTLFSCGTVEEKFDFAKPVTITIQYPESIITDVIENDLRLIFYDTETGEWVDGATTCEGGSDDSYVRDLENNTLQLPVCHQSRWSFGA